MKKLPFFVVAFILLLGSIFQLWKRWTEETKSLKVRFTYPIISLDPRIFDDWGSVFVTNHIFRRLVSDPNFDSELQIADQYVIRCAEDSNLSYLDKACKNIKIDFHLKELRDCEGNEISHEQIASELNIVLQNKPWILPKWQIVAHNPRLLTLVGEKLTDIRRRLRTLYFRFGFSYASEKLAKKKPIGTGPYCLTHYEIIKNRIIAGKLISHPQFVNPIPNIIFSSKESNSWKDPADIDIYGDENFFVKGGELKSVNTPVAFYVTSHDRFQPQNLLWNTPEVQSLIQKYLIKQNAIMDKPSAVILNLIPSGTVKRAQLNRIHPTTELKQFLIPDYLPHCQELAVSLNRFSKQQKFDDYHFYCSDLMVFLTEHVRGDRQFDGCLVVFTPGSPYPNNIQDQYFSPQSLESMTGQARNPEDLYYLVGVGDSLIRVNPQRILDVKVNSLGLGNIFVSDMILR